jgi:DNA-binding Lrp family transcriptional regulator
MNRASTGHDRRVVQAYVLIQTDLGRVGDVVTQMKGLAGVIRADTVTGPYDIVALLEQPTLEELGQQVVERIQVIDGVTRTLTCPLGAFPHL